MMLSVMGSIYPLSYTYIYIYIYSAQCERVLSGLSGREVSRVLQELKEPGIGKTLLIGNGILNQHICLYERRDRGVV